MPMSDYVRGLRARIGTAVLQSPTVTILTFDAQGRVLLVHQAEGNLWSTPGGMIEPYEVPADAAVRGMWEETGLLVELTAIAGVFGGPSFATVYDNGDRLSWVSIAFRANVIAGSPRADGEETLEVRYFDRAEIAALPRRPHVDAFVEAASRSVMPVFEPAKWRPPT